MTRRNWYRCAATALLWCASALAADPAAPPLRVLFIGNSYTYYNDLPETLRKLAASATPPVAIETARVLVGGSTLQQHWQRGKAQEAIREGTWDYVVLQEHSLLGGKVVEPEPVVAPVAGFFEFARLFNAEIRRTRARTIFYMPWSREAFPEQQFRISDAYRAEARELMAMVAPVGPAMMAARIGDPSISFYHGDHSHPKPPGTYLAACVFYAVITGRSPVGLPSREVGDSTKNETPVPAIHLPHALAAYLQHVAWRAVQEDPTVNPR